MTIPEILQGARVRDSIRREDRVFVALAYVWWLAATLTAPLFGSGLLVWLYPLGIWVVTHTKRNKIMAFHPRQALCLQIVMDAVIIL